MGEILSVPRVQNHYEFGNAERIQENLGVLPFGIKCSKHPKLFWKKAKNRYDTATLAHCIQIPNQLSYVSVIFSEC